MAVTIFMFSERLKIREARSASEKAARQGGKTRLTLLPLLAVMGDLALDDFEDLELEHRMRDLEHPLECVLLKANEETAVSAFGAFVSTRLETKRPTKGLCWLN